MDPKDQVEPIKYPENLHWYVIYTKPRDENRVKGNFEGMGIETLLPLYQKYVKGMHFELNPLFPSYLFARLNLESHFYKVKWTRGVNRILGVENSPVPISEIVIRALKERMREDGTVQLSDEFQVGSRVQITSGPLRDLVGIFQKGLSSGGRVRILLNMIGADLPVQIYRWQIKKVA